MATYLLDTNILIDVLNGRKNRPVHLAELLSEGHILACCPINVTEVYAGMRANEESGTEALLRSLQYFPITFEAAQLAGVLKRDYSKKGKTLNIADATIAAVAIENNLSLITDNARDFPMRELQLYTLPQS